MCSSRAARPRPATRCWRRCSGPPPRLARADPPGRAGVRSLPVTLLAARPSGLAERLAALDEILGLADGRLEHTSVEQARAVAAKAGERLRLGDAHTVVALAGATGSGKSSLANALAGEPVSQVGLRRPTTGVAHAVVWGSADAGPLLDWLEGARRHPPPAASSGFDGL